MHRRPCQCLNRLQIPMASPAPASEYNTQPLIYFTGDFFMDRKSRFFFLGCPGAAFRFSVGGERMSGTSARPSIILSESCTRRSEFVTRQETPCRPSRTNRKRAIRWLLMLMERRLLYLIGITAAFITPRWSDASDPKRYRDPVTGVSFQLPSAWTAGPPIRTSEHETTLRLRDPQSRALTVLDCSQPPEMQPYPEDIERATLGAINSRTRSRQQEGVRDYRLRRPSIENFGIGDLPAARWEADYTENGHAMVEYFTRIRGRKTIATFYTRLSSYRTSIIPRGVRPDIEMFRVPELGPASGRRPISSDAIPCAESSGIHGTSVRVENSRFRFTWMVYPSIS